MPTHFTIYKTTNLVNGRFYVGFHETEDPNDGYLGSGRAISQAIKKYGRENFRKEVLFDFPTREEMVAKEAELVTEEFVARDDTYNILPGGAGGWYVANKNYSREARAARGRKCQEVQRERAARDPHFRDRQKQVAGLQIKKLHAQGHAFARGHCNWAGRSHSEKAKAKMSEAGRRRTGERNSQHGTVWVCREGEAPRKVRQNELATLLAEGWQRGRRVRSKDT